MTDYVAKRYAKRRSKSQINTAKIYARWNGVDKPAGVDKKEGGKVTIDTAAVYAKWNRRPGGERNEK